MVESLNADTVPPPEGEALEINPQNDRRISILLFLGVLAVYLAVDTGQHYAYDGQVMIAVSMNLVNHGSLTTVGALNDVFHMSTPYSPYGIGMSLLGVFPVALSKFFGHSAAFISLVNPVLTAAAVIVTYWIGRALGWLANEAVMAALGFGLLSMALQYTTEYFSEPAVTLCCVAMVLGIIQWGQGRRYAPLVVGIAAGCALQFRSDSLITVWVGLLAVPMFVSFQKLRNMRALALAIVPMAISLALLVSYNEWRYSKLLTSYGGAFTTPLWTGLHGYLFSSGKSLFIFNPLTILGVVGLAILFQRTHNRPLGPPLHTPHRCQNAVLRQVVSLGWRMVLGTALPPPSRAVAHHLGRRGSSGDTKRYSQRGAGAGGRSGAGGDRSGRQLPLGTSALSAMAPSAQHPSDEFDPSHSLGARRRAIGLRFRPKHRAALGRCPTDPRPPCVDGPRVVAKRRWFGGRGTCTRRFLPPLMGGHVCSSRGAKHTAGRSQTPAQLNRCTPNHPHFLHSRGGIQPLFASIPYHWIDDDRLREGLRTAMCTPEATGLRSS